MKQLSKIKFLLPIWLALFIATFFLHSCHTEYDLEPRLYFEVNILETNIGSERTNIKLHLSQFNTELLESVAIKNITMNDFEFLAVEKSVDTDQSQIEINLSIPNNNFDEKALIKVMAESSDRAIATYYSK